MKYSFRRRTRGTRSRSLFKSYATLENRNLLATVFGTEGDDSIQVYGNEDFTEALVYVNNNEPVVVDTTSEKLVIDGLAGEDSLFLTGESFFIAATQFEADFSSDGVVSFDLDGVEVDAVGFAEIETRTVFDVQLIGSFGDDFVKVTRFASSDFFAEGEIAGVNFDFEGIGKIHIDGNGGTDELQIGGSESEDRFVGDSNSTEFYWDTFFPSSEPQLTSVDFEKVIVSAGNNSKEGFEDIAILTGTDGDEQLTGRIGTRASGSTTFTGDGFEYTINGFRTIDVDGGGGNDAAELEGSALVDSFYATDGYATIRNFFGSINYPLISSDPRYSIDLTGFSTVNADVADDGDVMTEGFRDVATIVGSENVESLVGLPTGTALIGDKGVKYRASGFNRVTGVAGSDDDVAYLADSNGDDSFIGNPELSYLRGVGFFNVADGFSQVYATSSNGGSDIARLIDSPDEINDVFYSTPDYALLQNDNHVNRATGFSYVKAISTSGEDTAAFIDSDGDDTFISSPTEAYLYDRQSYFNVATGFSRATAYASEGNDRAIAHGSSGDDRFVSTPTMSFMLGDGFFNQGLGFDKFDAIAGIGGEDTVIVFDSDEDDTLGGSQQAGWIFGSDYFNYWSGFQRVTAVAENGGTNNTFFDEIDYENVLVGDWVL